MNADTLRAVVGQLEIWWFGSVTVRMQGLTDDEYFWKPVPDAFCLTSRDGQLLYEWPPGSQGETTPPVTTIAWRMAHVAHGCFLNRWHTHFGDGPVEWADVPFPDNATDALEYLETWKTTWCDALRSAGEARLWEPLGETEYDVGIMQLGVDDPFIGLVLHLNREVMHHGAEICLLRDLYRATQL
jgi:hypothetical protein